MSEASYPTKLLVWTAAGGRCAYPGCENEIVVGSPQDPAHIGQVAHIVSPNGKGPRYDPGFPVEKLNHFSNLVALCRNHHGEVDGLLDEYPVERLREMKRAHEDRMRKSGRVERWEPNFVTAHYVNVSRLAMLAAFYGIPYDLTVERWVTLREAPFPAFLGLMDLTERTIRSLHPVTIPVTALTKKSILPPGTLISFNKGIRTRNVPYPQGEADLEYWQLTGVPGKDPHIYTDWKGRRYVMVLDMKFITSDTALSEFTRGSTRMAGLALVKSYGEPEAGKDVIYASPIVLGLAVDSRALGEAVGYDFSDLGLEEWPP